jgi:hypothetical protein
VIGMQLEIDNSGFDEGAETFPVMGIDTLAAKYFEQR